MTGVLTKMRYVNWLSVVSVNEKEDDLAGKETGIGVSCEDGKKSSRKVVPKANGGLNVKI